MLNAEKTYTFNIEHSTFNIPRLSQQTRARQGVSHSCYPSAPQKRKGETARMKRFLAVALVLFAVPLFAGGPKKSEIVKAKKKIPNSYIIVFEDRVEDVEGVAGDLTRL